MHQVFGVDTIRSAEWMLDVIGAGATATTTIDWHNEWNKSKEVADFKDHLIEIHEDGRKRPPVKSLQHSEFATSWGYQLYALTLRAFQSYWRNPTYIIAKEFLNISAGLFIGFTFFKTDSTVQGTQNKLFVRLTLWLAPVVVIELIFNSRLLGYFHVDHSCRGSR